jgi:hypothetical protein
LPAILATVVLFLPVSSRAAGGDAGKLSLFVDCHCSDPVGGDFCDAFKDKVKGSAGYKLVDRPDAYGLAVHLWCIDLFSKIPGIDSKLMGTMSAVSVAFTLYADRLPGEVYEDSSVFRVGKDATDDMAQSLLNAVGQIATANKAVFDKIRAAENPTPVPTPKIIQ